MISYVDCYHWIFQNHHFNLSSFPLCNMDACIHLCNYIMVCMHVCMYVYMYACMSCVDVCMNVYM